MEGARRTASSVRDAGLGFLFSADDNYAQGLAVAMHSTLAHLSPRIAAEVFVLDNGISEASRTRLSRVAAAAGVDDALRWISVPRQRLAPLQGRDTATMISYLTVAAYAPLLAPKLLPERMRRVVYFDSDVLVRRDVAPLLEMELRGAPFAAVRDFVVATRPQLRLDADSPYFNSGVLVIDLESWRRAGLGDRALAYAAEHGENLRFADQDALNAVADHWHELDPHWNVQDAGVWDARLPAPFAHTCSAFHRRGVVLHFNWYKPWFADCTRPGTWLWARSFLQSGWNRRLESVTWLAAWLCKNLIARTAGPKALAYASRAKAAVIARLRRGGKTAERPHDR